MGNPAIAGFSSIATQGWQLVATVSGANTVFVRLTNNTGGAVNLPLGTLTAVVFKP